MIRITGGGNIYQIYVDSYFLFHFSMNFWILFLCRFFYHSKIAKRRIILYSLLFALIESTLLCLPLGSGRLKLLFGFLGGTVALLWFLFQPNSYSAFSHLLISAYTTAILLGGSLLLIQRCFPKLSMNYFLISSLTGGITMAVGWIIQRSKAEKTNYLVEVELFFFNGEKKKLKALVDTGNSLIEPFSKEPVSVVEKESIKEYITSFSAKDYRVIPFCSVGNPKGLMDGFFIQGMKIYERNVQWEKEHTIIAIAEDNISFDQKYQMILHPKLLENQEERV